MFSTGLRNRFSLFALLAFCCVPLSSIHAKYHDPYQQWLNEDVHWIISNQERAEFLKLSTDQQRDEFVVAFWNHHNPAGSAANSFKTEHYRRLAFANEHFAATIPGWETDRGHVYIVYGPPDSIERSNKEANADYPSEVWHYRHLTGANQAMTIRFSDTCRCGEFKKVDSEEKTVE